MYRRRGCISLSFYHRSWRAGAEQNSGVPILQKTSGIGRGVCATKEPRDKKVHLHYFWTLNHTTSSCHCNPLFSSDMHHRVGRLYPNDKTEIDVSKLAQQQDLLGDCQSYMEVLQYSFQQKRFSLKLMRLIPFHVAQDKHLCGVRPPLCPCHLPISLSPSAQATLITPTRVVNGTELQMNVSICIKKV